MFTFPHGRVRLRTKTQKNDLARSFFMIKKPLLPDFPYSGAFERQAQEG